MSAPVTRMISALFAAAVMAALFGCGESVGDGSHTLFVTAEARTSGTRESTYFIAQIREGDASGRVVSRATVTLRGVDGGEWTIPYGSASFGPFQGGNHVIERLDWQPGWYIELSLDDEDWLEAYLEAPGLTQIHSPLGNTAFRPDESKNLTVSWEDTAGNDADTVEVDLSRNKKNYSLKGDPGRHRIPSSDISSKGAESVTVTRNTLREIEGGAAGSLFRASSRHRIDFVVE